MNKVCIFVEHNLILNCIFRIDLIGFQIQINSIQNIQFKIKLCTTTMHTLFRISLVLNLLKLSAGQE